VAQQPLPAQPPVAGQPAAQPPPPAPVVEAKKRVIVTWTLGEQEWDFNDVLSAYEPVKGVFDPNIHHAIWTLELAKDLLPGEVTLHQQEEGTPFKVVLLDAERVPLAVGAAVTVSPISGKKGDRIIATFAVAPDVMKIVKTVRVQRRTKVGFETPQVIGAP
jgi:hypothetical protein